MDTLVVFGCKQEVLGALPGGEDFAFACLTPSLSIAEIGGGQGRNEDAETVARNFVSRSALSYVPLLS